MLFVDRETIGRVLIFGCCVGFNVRGGGYSFSGGRLGRSNV